MAKEGIAKLQPIAFRRFHRFLSFDANPLLSRVCEFASNDKNRQNRAKIDLAGGFATPSKKIAFLFPGQGAQYPAMAKDFYDAFAVVKQTFEEADTFLNQNFSYLIFEGSSEELTLTKNSQLAIYIVGVALRRLVKQQLSELRPHTCAGLSLGEYTALTAADKLSFSDGLGLVKLRAEAMQRACESKRGSMHVVLGLSEEQVQEALLGVEDVWIANLNCPGQVVIAGTVEGLESGAAPLKQKGARRILPLEVSGAFHSGLMLPAQEELALKIAETTLEDSSCQIVMNAVGEYTQSIAQIRENLIRQLTSAVRWEKGIRAMEREGVDFYVEFAPGKTLSGMNKRIGVKEPSYSLERVSDLDALKEVLCSC